MAFPLVILGVAAFGAAAEEPIKVVEESVEIPADLDPAAALASVADISRIFELYEPEVPSLPGVSIALDKQVLSEGTPTVLELPVHGKVFGKDVTERARVTATTTDATCADGVGKTIVLSFDQSSHNIERRIDRIEIVACLVEGGTRLVASGRMYAGAMPEDPTKNAFTESVGSKALQGAFMRQVDPIVDAVERHWLDLPRAEVAMVDTASGQ